MDKEVTEKDKLSFNSLLPKKLEASEEGKKVLDVLNSHLRAVKPAIKFTVPSFAISQSVIDALYSARRTGRLVRGFKDAEKNLAAERKGIANVDLKAGSAGKGRISRLVVLASDGSERFYRQTKRLTEQNRPRVMAIHLDVTSFELGEKLFGPKERALLLLLNHKEALVNLLISLIR